MTRRDTGADLEISRRKLLAAAGIGGGAVVAASLVGIGDAEAAARSRRPPDPAVATPVAGLHLQFGADASSEMVVSWHTLQPVRNPRVMLGRLDGKLEQMVEAKGASYTDAKSSKLVYAYHAKLGRLHADSAYLYATLHDGAEPEFGTFRTSPRGRAAFTFTSFGDQGTPTLGRKYVPPAGVTLPNAPYVRQSRLARGERYHARRGAAAALVPPAQRRSLLCQHRRGPGAHLVGFLGEQQPQRP